MFKKRFLILFAAYLFTTISSNAQTQFSGWLASFNTFNIDDKSSIHFDGQIRSSDQVQHLQTLLLRAGYNYKLRKNIIATAGYAYISNRRLISNVSGYAPEHRIWEQLIINHHVSFIPVQQRFRLEQRFLPISMIENGRLKTNGSEYANRFRYFTRGVIPFSGEKQFGTGLFAALQNEVMLNFGDKSTVNGKTFDQNRLYFAVGYRLNPRLDIETGYMNQYVSGRNDAFSNNHIWQIAVYVR